MSVLEERSLLSFVFLNISCNVTVILGYTNTTDVREHLKLFLMPCRNKFEPYADQLLPAALLQKDALNTLSP